LQVSCHERIFSEYLGNLLADIEIDDDPPTASGNGQLSFSISISTRIVARSWPAIKSDREDS
jgi:hypothetical protein